MKLVCWVVILNALFCISESHDSQAVLITAGFLTINFEKLLICEVRLLIDQVRSFWSLSVLHYYEIQFGSIETM